MPLRPRQPSGGGGPTTLALLATLILTGGSIAPAPDASPGQPTAAPGTGSKTKSAPRSAAPALRWPLEIPGTLLSTFGEYRYDHLHAGIDISTRGGTGYRVLAAAAGEIFRLKVEWRGYGRALYLRHAGGRVTVYGHLQRYEDTRLGLERLVARRQEAAGNRYPGDIYLERPIRVAQGQVIAYSGESGVGLPHLHFEVREAGDAPIDPFEAGLPRPVDRRPPVLASLTVTAASRDSFIDGEAREVVYPIGRDAAGHLAAARPVRVSGPFLAAISAYDPTGDSGRAGIASLELSIDGAARYRLALRSFRFDQYPQSGLIFDHRFSRLGPAAFAYRLARLPGNDFGRASGEGGPPTADVHPAAIDLPPGSHQMEIAAADSAGNRTRARVCVQVGRPSAPDGIEWEGGPGDQAVVRFHLPSAHPAPDAVKAGARPPCAATSSRGVEGEFWDARAREFRPAKCSVDEGLCRSPDKSGTSLTALRLRAVSNGVPGPWSLVARDGQAPALHDDVAVRVEAWPAFVDILVPLDDPLAPPLSLSGGLGRIHLDDLSYRDDLFMGAGVGYSRAAGMAPFIVAVADHGTPVANLGFDVRWVEAGRSLDYQGPGFSLHLPEGARFFAGPVALRTETTPGTERLPSVADAIEILPEGEALNDRATLSFVLSPGAIAPESLGIYRWDRQRARWSYEGGDLQEGGTRLSLSFRRYGRFALLQDASPPALLEVWPSPGSSLTPGRSTFTARVEDEGKGLNYDGVTFELDGHRLDSEFDPDRGLAKVLDPPPLSAGRHHLRVVAADLAGNESEPIEGDFLVRSRK